MYKVFCSAEMKVIQLSRKHFQLFSKELSNSAKVKVIQLKMSIICFI